MEAIVFGVITTIWWLTSISILLPFIILLKLNPFLRGQWFSFFLRGVVGPYLRPRVLPLRKKTFALLQEHLRNKSQELEVLEIGVGGGSNLEFYPENWNVTALDKEEDFGEYFLENVKKHSQVRCSGTVVACAENMEEIGDGSKDLVICTYLLCSVESVPKVLEEVIRVLKPGGKFLFLEHVAFKESLWRNIVQRYASPLWYIYLYGCRINRHTAAEIQKAKFSSVLLKNILPDSLIMFMRPQVFGIATK